MSMTRHLYGSESFAYARGTLEHLHVLRAHSSIMARYLVEVCICCAQYVRRFPVSVIIN